MKQHGNEALIEWVVAEVFNTGNVAVIDKVGTNDLCVHYPQAGEPLCGADEVKRAFSRTRAAFSDAYFVIEDRVVADNSVVIRWTGRATHTGTFWRIQATGRLVTWTGVSIHRFARSKIAEIWIYADALSLLQQLEGTQRTDESDAAH